MDTLIHQLIETWYGSNRVTLYLLEPIDCRHLTDRIEKGRTVAEQFAHIHNVRLMWLSAAAPDLAEGLMKIEKEEASDKEILSDGLNASAHAVATLLERSFEAGKVKNFKPHPAAFLGYLLSHEAHHRGQIVLTLKHCGHPIDKKISFGLWEWSSRMKEIE